MKQKFYVKEKKKEAIKRNKFFSSVCQMAQVYTTEEANDYHLIEDLQQDFDQIYNELDIEKLDVDQIDSEELEATIQYHAYIKNELDKNYPFKYVIAHSICMTIFNVALIVLQIIAIKKNAAFADLGLAIWVPNSFFFKFHFNLILFNLI